MDSDAIFAAKIAGVIAAGVFLLVGLAAALSANAPTPLECHAYCAEAGLLVESVGSEGCECAAPCRGEVSR